VTLTFDWTRRHNGTAGLAEPGLYRANVCLFCSYVSDGHGTEQKWTWSGQSTDCVQSIISLLTVDKTHMLTLNTELQYKKSIALGWVGLDGVGFGHKTVI